MKKTSLDEFKSSADKIIDTKILDMIIGGTAASWCHTEQNQKDKAKLQEELERNN